MHIHSMLQNYNSALLYSNAGAEKAQEAHRAAETRKRLLKAAQENSSEVSPEEGFLVGHWLDNSPSRALSPEQYYAANSGKDEDFGGF